ncbi:hypothetical protein Aph02nite_22140 [Actinoplanes philippinensis]|uniref:PKD domain-containing protein n=1 Tax=Actinoplanes philippinensis TaxID=35752 RepID=A0A1I2C4F2_9ACTN|nr:hypothetical protein [Actinoplanes philippinensis]GIE76264.1 hypothetical protein Aph02nite_22140 [Actinoplanes philippinensis]SFE62663.1 hypothetical protein SAMN05421541_102683 [Actinoplanes philippinensis]
MKRWGAVIALTIIAATTAVVHGGSPAMAAESADLSLTSWAYVDSQSPRAKVVDAAVTPPVGTSHDDAQRAHTYRSYFTYDLTGIKDTVVHSSYLSTTETAVTDCSVPVTVEVWRTRPVKDNTSWLRPPAELEKLASAARGAGSRYCPSFFGLDMVGTLNAALGRHEKSITLELRITAAQEATPNTGRTYEKPRLSATVNHPPRVTDQHLIYPDRGCGTLAKPSPATRNTYFSATARDADEGDHASLLFAIWPVDHPDQRREFRNYYSTDLSQYAHGTVLAWQAQASDYYDAGPWSRTCYIVMDTIGPADAPKVSSRTYPEGDTPGGGSGIEGTFRFDAAGDRDVVAFAWRDSLGSSGRIAARHPGGKAILKYTPQLRFETTLVVSSIDAAGNGGPDRTYRFRVAETAPRVDVTVNGVGLPSTITFVAAKPETTAFGYQIGNGAEVRLPAVDGRATGSVTFTTRGTAEVAVRSYAKNKLIGQDKVQVWVTDAPGVESAEFTWDTDQVAGKTGSFTFRPRNSDVAAYEYYLDDEWKTIPAAADGTAVLTWTATPGWHSMVVRSIASDESRSLEADYQFNIIDTRPTAYAYELSNWPRRDGVGVPLEIELGSRLPNLTGFAYRFDGGPEKTVSNEGNPYATITVTPRHAGDNSVVVEALLADGTRSPATTYTFGIWSGPVVTWAPEGSGTVGRPVTFTFHPGLPDVASYRYSVDGADEQTIPAGADGTATVTHTPQSWGYSEVRVTSVGSDGTESDLRAAPFDVRDNRVDVYSTYDWSRRGIGWTGYFYFYTQLFGEVTEYQYRVNDGPEQILPASTDGTSTLVAVPFDRNGTNVIHVRSRTAGGELSPVTDYEFTVGDAPYVVSEQYPDSSWSGGGGVPGTFEFSGGTPGIVSFSWQIDDGPVTDVPADSTGAASITYTPPANFESHTLSVTGHKADGTETGTTRYYIYVSNHA